MTRTTTTLPGTLPAFLPVLLLVAVAGCAPSGGVDQSSPQSLALGVVEAARRGEDVTGYALADADSGEPCTQDTCSELEALRRATGVCADLEGALSTHVETANRDDSTSVLVYVTTEEDDSGRCGMHVSRYGDRWWLSD